MRRFDFILFDADNTLFDYDRAERHALETALGELGVEFGPDVHETYREINSDYWHRFEKGEVTVEELRIGRFADFANAVGLSATAADTASSTTADPRAAGAPEDDARLEDSAADATDNAAADTASNAGRAVGGAGAGDENTNGARLSRRYLELLGTAGFLIDGAEDVVNRLAAEGYRLALITNGLETVQKGRLARSPLRDAFVSVTISDEVGAQKPDPAIFEIAFGNSGNPPKDRSIIVGDSITSDIAGGRAFGIATCWFNPKNLPVPIELAETGKAPDYVISELKEIEEIVGGGEDEGR